MQDPEFENSLIQPSKLNFLRALLLGVFSDNLLELETPKKTAFSTRENHRTARLSGLSSEVEESTLKEGLKIFGTVENVRCY